MKLIPVASRRKGGLLRAQRLKRDLGPRRRRRRALDHLYPPPAERRRGLQVVVWTRYIYISGTRARECEKRRLFG